MAIVRVFVSGLEKAMPFYTALGFAVKDQWGPAFAMLEHGDLELWLSGPTTSAAQPWTDGTQPGPGGFTRIVLPLSLWNANQATVESAGGRICNGPISGPGGTQLIVFDPDGNSIEFFE